jgi:hypothetical protein
MIITADTYIDRFMSLSLGNPPFVAVPWGIGNLWADGGYRQYAPFDLSVRPDEDQLFITFRLVAGYGGTWTTEGVEILQVSRTGFDGDVSLETGVGGGLNVYFAGGLMFSAPAALVSPTAAYEIHMGMDWSNTGERSIELFVDGVRVGSVTPADVTFTGHQATSVTFFTGDIRGADSPISVVIGDFVLSDANDDDGMGYTSYYVDPRWVLYTTTANGTYSEWPNDVSPALPHWQSVDRLYEYSPGLWEIGVLGLTHFTSETPRETFYLTPAGGLPAGPIAALTLAVETVYENDPAPYYTATGMLIGPDGTEIEVTDPGYGPGRHTWAFGYNPFAPGPNTLWSWADFLGVQGGMHMTTPQDSVGITGVYFLVFTAGHPKGGRRRGAQWIHGY